MSIRTKTNDQIGPNGAELDVLTSIMADAVGPNEPTAQEPKPKAFRLSAKRLFLTYSQVPSEATKEELLVELQQNISFDHYVISKEPHKDGGAHFHAILQARTKFNIRQAQTLDVKLGLNKDNFHGNYQKVRNYGQAIEYVCKDGDYITSVTDIKDGKLKSFQVLAHELYEAHGREAALRLIFEEDLKRTFGSAKLIEIDKLFKLLDEVYGKQPKTVTSPYELSEFRRGPQLLTWEEAKHKLTLMLIGKTGTGKTAWLMAFMAKHKLKPLQITHKQGLKDLAPEHTAIIANDYSFKEDANDPEQVLALFETQQPTQMRILYQCITKPSGLVQVFTCNREGIRTIVPMLNEERFLRRIEVVHIADDFIIDKSPTVNIQINNFYQAGHADSEQKQDSGKAAKPSQALLAQRAKIEQNRAELVKVFQDA